MDDYQLNIKERYKKIVELQHIINSELDSLNSFLSQLISDWDHAKQTLIHKPDYQPVLQTQEELLDEVTTDQVTLFDVIKESISNETLNEMIIDTNQTSDSEIPQRGIAGQIVITDENGELKWVDDLSQESKDKIDEAVRESLITGKSIREIKLDENAPDIQILDPLGNMRRG